MITFQDVISNDNEVLVACQAGKDLHLPPCILLKSAPRPLNDRQQIDTVPVYIYQTTSYPLQPCAYGSSLIVPVLSLDIPLGWIEHSAQRCKTNSPVFLSLNWTKRLLIRVSSLPTFSSRIHLQYKLLKQYTTHLDPSVR